METITVNRDVLSELLNYIEPSPSNSLARWLAVVEGEMDADSVVTLCVTVKEWTDPAVPSQPRHLRRLK